MSFERLDVEPEARGRGLEEAHPTPSFSAHPFEMNFSLAAESFLDLNHGNRPKLLCYAGSTFRRGVDFTDAAAASGQPLIFIKIDLTRIEAS